MYTLVIKAKAIVKDYNVYLILQNTVRPTEALSNLSRCHTLNTCELLHMWPIQKYYVHAIVSQCAVFTLDCTHHIHRQGVHS